MTVPAGPPSPKTHQFTPGPTPLTYKSQQINHNNIQMNSPSQSKHSQAVSPLANNYPMTNLRASNPRDTNYARPHSHNPFASVSQSRELQNV